MKIVSTPQSRSSQSGFTLIETVLASVVMMVGLLAMAQVFVLAALYNQSSKQTTLATSLAHRKLEQLLALPLPTAETAPLGYGGSLGASSATNGYVENYHVDPTTKEVRLAATGEAISYVVTWSVAQDPGVPAMPGVRVITVRAEATRAALTGNEVAGTSQAPEVAEISTIRTPSQ